MFTSQVTTFKDTLHKGKQNNTKTETKLVKRMQGLKKKVTGDKTDVPVSTIVGRWPLIDNILGFAGDYRIDLGVMGTKGAGSLKKPIGTVAARIVEKTAIPVLLVPKKFKWVEPKRFVFAANYLQTDRQALSVVLALGKLYAAAVTVVHMVDVFAMEENEKSYFNTYASDLQKEFIEFHLEFKLMKTSSISETMENLYKEIPYDMLAMVSRRKTFMDRFILRSFTKNMVCVTNHPLLAVPEEE